MFRDSRFGTRIFIGLAEAGCDGHGPVHPSKNIESGFIITSKEPLFVLMNLTQKNTESRNKYTWQGESWCGHDVVTRYGRETSRWSPCKGLGKDTSDCCVCRKLYWSSPAHVPEQIQNIRRMFNMRKAPGTQCNGMLKTELVNEWSPDVCISAVVQEQSHALETVHFGCAFTWRGRQGEQNHPECHKIARYGSTAARSQRAAYASEHCMH
jgi:hypothetical protein